MDHDVTAENPDCNLLSWLARNEHATASEVSHASGITLPSARSRLRHLERQKLVVGKPNDAVPSRRVYHATAEGRRAARVSDAGSTTA